MACLDSIFRRLKEEGLKLTPQRKLLLEILFETEGHLSAEEIFDKVKVSQPNVSFGTIYRNLSLLAEINLVNQLNFRDGLTRFELSLDHHHHLVCLGCGNAIDVHECSFGPTLQDTALANDFFVKDHILEVFGYCKGCNSLNVGGAE